MEKKLLELEKEIDQVNVTLKELIQEFYHRNEEDKEEKIDFDIITEYSKSTAFSGHYITKISIEKACQICLHLAGVVDLLRDKAEKMKQYYFLARILASLEEPISLEELAKESKHISAADFNKLRIDLSDDEKLIFLINLLLMISLNGKINELQLDYFCEIASFFIVSREQLEIIMKVVKCFLLSQEEIYDYANAVPLREVICFKQNNAYDKMIIQKDEKEKIAACEGDRIIICGVTFSNEELLIDDYQKKHITFYQCTFEKMYGISASETEVVFKDCKFYRCFSNQQEDNELDLKKSELFYFKNTKISGCFFEECGFINKKGLSILLNMRGGEISDSTFMACRVIDEGINIREDRRWSCASIVHGYKTIIKSCKFVSCCAYSNNHYFLRHLFTDNQCMHIVMSIKGRVEACEFEICQCIESEHTAVNNANRYYYIINSNESEEKDNVFKKCDAKKNIGSIDWEY